VPYPDPATVLRLLRFAPTTALPVAGHGLETQQVSGLKRMGILGTSRGLGREPIQPRARPAGARGIHRVRGRGHFFFRALGIVERVVAMAFIEDMATAYAEADRVVASTGASTLAGLAIAGRPAILIPPPTPLPPFGSNVSVR